MLIGIKIYPHNDDEYGVVISFYEEGQEEIYFLYVESSKKFIRPEFSEEYDNLSDLLIQEEIYGEKNNQLVNVIKESMDLRGML